MPDYNSIYSGAQIDQTISGENNEVVEDTAALKNLTPSTNAHVLVFAVGDYVWRDGDTTLTTERSTGSATSSSPGKLIDSAATFQTDGVQGGDLAYNTTQSTSATVSSVDSETQLTLSDDIFITTDNYKIGLATDNTFYITSSVSTYGPMESEEGRWVAEVVSTQQGAIATLTDSTGGATDGTLTAISGSGADADLNNNFAELAANQALILAALRAWKIIA